MVDELEALKPEFDRIVEERNRAYDRLQLDEHDESASTSYYSGTSSLEWPSVNRISYTGVDMKKVLWKQCYLNQHADDRFFTLIYFAFICVVLVCRCIFPLFGQV